MARQSFLDKFLSHLDAAPAVLDLAVARYGTTRSEALCANPRFGSRLAPLLSAASARSLHAALDSMDYAVLDAALDTPTRSLQVLEAIPDFWDLSLADQKRLVGRRLPVKAARQLMGRPHLAPEIQAAAAKYVDIPSCAAWLSHSSGASALSDAEVFTLLEAIAQPATVLSALVPVLLDRPALRPRAIKSSRYLRVAACWTPLEPDDLAATLTWLSHDPLRHEGTDHDPNAAILTQLGLPFDYRTSRRQGRTWDLTDRRVLRALAIPSPSSPLYRPGSLSSTADLEYLDLVVDRLIAPPHERQPQLILGGQLLELARNPHLDLGLAERCLGALCAYANATTIPAFRHAAVTLARSCRPRTNPMTTLKKYSLNYAAEQAITDDLIPRRYPRRSKPRAGVRVPHPARTGRPPKPSEYNSAMLIALASSTIRMSSVVSHVCGTLGDGSSSDSLAAWANLFHFLDSSPTQPLDLILDTARLLTSE